MNEYVPTEEDLRDFEEFQKELEAEREIIGSIHGKNIYGIMYCVSHRGKPLKLLREALLDIVVCDLTCFEGIHSRSVMQRLNMVELLGFDKYEIASVISPELSKKDLDNLFGGKNYPYLYTGLNAWLGDEKIEEAIATREESVKKRLLPFTAFNFISDTRNKELLFTRLQLIEQSSFESRPLHPLRVYVLSKGNELGYWDYHNFDINVRPRVDTRKFLALLFSECQNIPETLKYQFGVTTTKYSIDNSKVRFSLAISSIQLIEEYFRVRLVTDSLYSYKRGLMSLTVDRRDDTLYLPLE